VTTDPSSPLIVRRGRRLESVSGLEQRPAGVAGTGRTVAIKPLTRGRAALVVGETVRN